MENKVGNGGKSGVWGWGGVGGKGGILLIGENNVQLFFFS